MASDIFLFFCFLLLLIIINLLSSLLLHLPFPLILLSRNISVHYVQCNNLVKKYKSLNVLIYHLQKSLMGKTVHNDRN